MSFHRFLVAAMTALPVLAAPQQRAPADREAHAAGVYFERRDAFVRAWSEATPEGRSAAREVFAARRPFGAGAVVAVPVPFLAQATRLAREERLPDAPVEPLLAAADLLDLRLVPGALPANEALEATVVAAWAQAPDRTDLEGAVEMTIALIGPSGADSEVRPLADFEVDLAAITVHGAGLRVAVPALAAGEYQLAAELRPKEGEGFAVASFATPVEVVAGFAEGVAERPLPQGSALEQLVWHGVRTVGRPRLSAWIDGASALTRSASFAFAGPAPDEPARATLFLDVPRQFEPSAWLAGPEGQTWQALGELGVRIVALHVDLLGGESIGSAPRAVLDLARLDPDARRIVVVRGERAGGMMRILRGSGEAFQGVVLMTAQVREAVPEVPGQRPTLVVASLAEADVEPEELAATKTRGPRRVVRRWAPPLVVEREVPALVADWLPGFLETVPAVPPPRPDDGGKTEDRK